MKFVVFATLFVLAPFASAFHIVPPSGLTTCASVTIDYDTRTGQAPFNLAFHTGSADGPVVAAFTDITGSSFTWNQVAIASGTQIVIVLGDSSGKGSGTPVITVAQGSSTDCVGNPTSIPTLPIVTSSSPPTSSYGGPSSSSSSSEPSTSTSLSTTTITSTTSTSVSTTTITSTTSANSGLSSSLSSVSSVVSSVNSVLSSLTGTTSTTTSTPSTTGGLGTNGGLTNTAGVYTVGAISAVIGALLA